MAAELSRVNLRLVRASSASSDQTTLLDQRDSLLQKLSEYVDVSTSIAPDQTVSVRIAGASGPQLVAGGSAATFGLATAADGTISFTLDGSAVTPSSGALTGKAQALQKLGEIRSDLDTIATDVISALNAAQANGVALDG